eukprot:GHVP01067692.1.p1 GENE.GHVP01067692.1~~GHVP01067692.1.p1  ORF type:complete len:104 (-),score=19.66 GHVP01067692.1:209-520(-)
MTILINPANIFEDYFKLVVIDFPPRIYQKAEFYKKCEETRTSLNFPSQYSRKIRANQFYQFCKSIWSPEDPLEKHDTHERNIIADEFKERNFNGIKNIDTKLQ